MKFLRYYIHILYLFIQIIILLLFFSIKLPTCCFAQTESIEADANSSLSTESDTSPAIEETTMIEDDYHYNPSGKRDPFYSKILDDENNEPKPKPPIGLRKYELSELNLVGIVSNNGEKKAVIESPEGKSYIIKNGTPLGKKNGVVMNITENEVEILEYTSDYLNNKVENTTILKLTKKDEEEEEEY